MSVRTSSTPPTPTLEAGAIVGGRFRIERLLGSGSLGQVYVAVDDRTGKKTALRHVPAAAIRDAEDIEQVRAGVRAAALLVHRNIVGTYGLGQEPSGDLFITMEYVEGENLRALLERRVAAGKQFSLRGAFNVAAHLCNALEFAHGKSTLHGSLSPHHVLIGRTGRVKLAGFPVSRILPSLRTLSSSLRMYLVPYLPPEGRDRARKMDARADVYSVAAVLFELLGGRPRPGIAPNAEALPPSVPPQVRAVLVAALDQDPGRRPASASALKNAIEAALVGVGEIDKGDDDLSIDVDVDVGEASPAAAIAPPPGAASSPPPPPHGARPSAPSGPPRRGSRIPIEASFRGEALQPSAPSIAGLSKPSTTAVDFGAILGELDADDLERWMLQRDKLDHGPFRDRELAEMILRGGALAEHTVTNLETGKRAKLKHVEEFKPFLDKYRIRKKQEEEQEAIRRSVRVERFGLAAKAGIAAGILVAVAGASAGLYYGLRGGGGEAAAVREDHKVALAGPSQVKGIQDIEVEVLEKVPPAADVAKQKSRRRPGSPGTRQSAGSGRAAGGMEDWDSAWTRGGDLDLASGDSAAPILTARDINAKMRSKQGALFSCLRGEMSRDPGLHGRVNIEMLIRGDRIVSVRSPDRSGAFENCLQDALSSVRFDAQAYGQMRSVFSMEVNR